MEHALHSILAAAAAAGTPIDEDILEAARNVMLGADEHASGSKRPRNESHPSEQFTNAADVHQDQQHHMQQPQGHSLPLPPNLLASFPGLHQELVQLGLNLNAAAGNSYMQEQPQHEMHYRELDGQGNVATLAQAGPSSSAPAPAISRPTPTRAGSRTQRDKVEATREKNRKAQQRFRDKQRTKLGALEIEVVRLRDLLLSKGIDPGEASVDNASGGGEAPQSSMSIDSMYEQLELWVESCTTIEGSCRIRYLQFWLNKLSDDARRLHFKAIQRRINEGKTEEVASWVSEALQQLQ